MITGKLRSNLFSKTALALAAAMTLSACQTGPGRDVVSVFEEAPTAPLPGQSQEQFRLAQLTHESEQIRGQALLAGAGVGVMLAFTICDDGPISPCGAVAVIAGGAIGYGAGMYVAEKSQLAKEQQDNIDGSIQAANAALATYTERADVAESVVAQNRAVVQAMNTTAAATDADRELYRAQYENMQNDRDRIAALQSQLENDLEFMELELNGRQDSGDPNTDELLTKRNELAQVNRQLTDQLNAMNGILDDVPDSVSKQAIS